MLNTLLSIIAVVVIIARMRCFTKDMTVLVCTHYWYCVRASEVHLKHHDHVIYASNAPISQLRATLPFNLCLIDTLSLPHLPRFSFFHSFFPPPLCNMAADELRQMEPAALRQQSLIRKSLMQLVYA